MAEDDLEAPSGPQVLGLQVCHHVYFIFMLKECTCGGVLPTGKSVCHVFAVPQRPEEDIGSPRAGVRGGSASSKWNLGIFFWNSSKPCPQPTSYFLKTKKHTERI